MIFLNDVAAGSDDILDMIHQCKFQQADMTCAMNWTFLGTDPAFHGSWTAREMRDDAFLKHLNEKGLVMCLGSVLGEPLD